jgi:hypothetical protein
MRRPVPWSAVTDIWARMTRSQGYAKGMRYTYKTYQLEIALRSPEQYLAKDPGLQLWFREPELDISDNHIGFADKSYDFLKNPNVVSLQPEMLKGGAKGLLAAMVDLGPLCASRARLQYLRSLKHPKKNAKEIVRELNRPQ